MKFSKIFPLFTILLSVAISLYLYPYLPDTLATHWGLDGNVDGYSSKFVGLFIMPIISTFLYLLFSLLPVLPTYKHRWSEFDQYFYLFISLMFGFLFYVYLLTMFWNLGLRFHMGQAVAPFLAIILFYSGHLSIVSRRNWFVGIRTPWAMKSDKVWVATNRFGGNCLKVISLFSLVMLALPQIGLFLFVASIFLLLPITYIYSYIIHRRLV